MTSNGALDVVFCDHCLTQRGKTVDMVFFLFTCQHIVCQKCLQTLRLAVKGGLALCFLCKKQVTPVQVEKLPPEYKKFVSTNFILKTVEDLARVTAFREKRLIYLTERRSRLARSKTDRNTSLHLMQEKFAMMQKAIKEQQIRIEEQKEQLLLAHSKIKAYEDERLRSKKSFTQVTSECEYLRRENSRLESQNCILSSQRPSKPSFLGIREAGHRLAALGLQPHSQATIKTPLSKHLLKGIPFTKTPMTNESSIPGSAGELAKIAKASHAFPRW